MSGTTSLQTPDLDDYGKRGPLVHPNNEIGIAAGILSGIQREGVRDKQNLGAVSRDLLSQCDLFRGLAADQCQGLLARARMDTFMPEESIFLMGSEADCMMAMLTGRVQISVSAPDGNEVVLAILGPGQIFGEISLLDTGERTADAMAMTECSLAILYRRDVLAFFDEHPIAWSNIVSVLCERLRRADEQISEVAMVSLPVRLAKALLRMTPRKPELALAYAPSPVRLTQRQLGKVVGGTRESVNKHLGVWQRKGVIRITKGSIAVEDRSALEDLAQVELRD